MAWSSSGYCFDNRGGKSNWKAIAFHQMQLFWVPIWRGLVSVHEQTRISSKTIKPLSDDPWTKYQYKQTWSKGPKYGPETIIYGEFPKIRIMVKNGFINIGLKFFCLGIWLQHYSITKLTMLLTLSQRNYGQKNFFILGRCPKK